MEDQGWKSLFTKKPFACISIGVIVWIIGSFTPYADKTYYMALGMVLLGIYFWILDVV